MDMIETEVLRDGKRIGRERMPSEIRESVLRQLKAVGGL
jgi:hypothetical protein